jgi:septal ring factor EnvC (AmiA/AmiB activator)
METEEKKTLLSWIPWIVTLIFAVGTIVATVGFQGKLLGYLRKDIESLNKSMVSQQEKVNCMDKTLVKIESTQTNMKEDISEINAMMKADRNIIKGVALTEVE